jgi:flavin-dependent dehydrogenase
MRAVLLLLLAAWQRSGCVAAASTGTSAQYDVVVYGATPGGVSAAVAAAREANSAANSTSRRSPLRVVLLEPGLYVGGAISGGLGQADYGQAAMHVLGGQSEEFFQRVASYYNVPFYLPEDRQCSAHQVPWVSEPHVAEQVLVDMLHAAGVVILTGTRIVEAEISTANVSTNGVAITSVKTANGAVLSAQVFIDGTYEGALMKMAGVTTTWGREANTTYKETAAGRLPTLHEAPVWCVPLQ